MKLRIRDIAALLQAEIEGEPDTWIDKVAKIEEGEAGAISFLANPRYLSFIYSTQASAVLVQRDFRPEKPVSATLLRVDDPYSAFTSLLEQVQAQLARPQVGISDKASIAPDAEIGTDVYIGPFAYVGPRTSIETGAQIHPFAYIGAESSIGAGTTVHAHATVYTRSQIGPNCLIHAGARIGSDGFGFAPQADGSLKKIPQTGIVVLEAEVEVGANCCIDRATMGDTRIKAGAKLDNLVQIAHNVEIGSGTALAAQSGVAGSTKIGAHCMIGGQAGIVGHLEIAPQTMIDAQSGVNRSIKKPGQAFRGSPVQPHRQQLKSEVLFRHLESMQKRITALEKALQALEGETS